MGYERYPRGTTGGYYNRDEQMDYGRDYGSGRDYSYSSARDYESTGEIGGNRGSYGRSGGRGYGDRDQGNRTYGGGDFGNRDYGSYGNRDYARDNSYGGQGAGNRDFGRDYGNRDFGSGDYNQRYSREVSGGQPYYGSQGSGRDNERSYDRDRSHSASYGRAPQGYSYDDRGFFDRAGDEVRSWFGDDEAERRRRMDQRYDQRMGNDYGNLADRDRDSDYHSWRSGQIAALDRDYDEYRDENRQKFHNEFSSWRTDRGTQRDSLSKVTEHMDVVGSDDAHVGTVDKVRGDRIILTKSDQDAGGRHHSIPSRWIQTVDDKVTLRKTADEAHAHWRDEERNQAFFSDNADENRSKGSDDQGRMLNKSFSGTY